MDQFREKIQALKNMLVTNDEFKDTFKYFFDNLGENEAFVGGGKIVKSKIMKGTLDSVSRQIFGVPATIAHLRLLKTGKENFLHGSCFLNGKVAVILYFEDINTGMLGISMSPATGQMSYVRFSGTVIEGNKIAFFMGSASKTVQ